MKICIKRVLTGDEHTDQKWLVFEGSVEGCPAVTKRRVVNTYALVQGRTTKQAERKALKRDVREYYERWLATQNEPDDEV